MEKKSKIYLEYVSVMNTPRYYVTKLINRVEPNVGDSLLKNEVSRLMCKRGLDVIITKKK